MKSPLKSFFSLLIIYVPLLFLVIVYHLFFVILVIVNVCVYNYHKLVSFDLNYSLNFF